MCSTAAVVVLVKYFIAGVFFDSFFGGCGGNEIQYWLELNWTVLTCLIESTTVRFELGIKPPSCHPSPGCWELGIGNWELRIGNWE